jgi:hypothetical protein
MTNQTEQGAALDLRAALQRLDAACDRRASLLDAAAYSAAIAIPGMQEALDELDAARSSARAALAHTPEGYTSVPLEFLRGFLTLAHNYSLTAEAPCYYYGVERDAFSDAYARCGQDLGKLRAMLGPHCQPPATPGDSHATP